jgi:hypothetical protein
MAIAEKKYSLSLFYFLFLFLYILKIPFQEHFPVLSTNKSNFSALMVLKRMLSTAFKPMKKVDLNFHTVKKITAWPIYQHKTINLF